MAKCAEMTANKKTPKQCVRNAVEQVQGRPLCRQHANAELEQEITRARAAETRAELDVRITDYIAYRKDHPSVWD